MHVFSSAMSTLTAPAPPAVREAHGPRLGAARRPLRRRVPGGHRRVDVRRRAPLDPRRPGHVHELAAVDRQRLRAGLRRVRPAGRPRRGPAGPAAHVPDRAGRVHRLLGARGPGHRGLDAHRGPVRHRDQRGVHHPGSAVHHHHDLSRGTRAQQGAADLRRDGRGRLPVRPRGGRAADHDRLALGVLRPGGGGRRVLLAAALRLLPADAPRLRCVRGASTWPARSA